MKKIIALIFALSIPFSAFAGSDPARTDYVTIAASQTDKVLGAAGFAGDILEQLVIVPASTSPGNVQIKDGSGSAITVFQGGATSVADVKTIVIHLGIRSTSGTWKITTGANVSVIAGGRFQ